MLMQQSDFRGLPDKTCQFVERLYELGLDRTKIHGFFVILGLYVGSPRTQEEIDNILESVDALLPIDRQKNIDDTVAHVFQGYGEEINEFCFRVGTTYDFAQLRPTLVHQPRSIVNPGIEGVLHTEVVAIENSSDASLLMNAFMATLGKSTATQNGSLLEAFSCGIYQTQLYALLDADGARWISEIVRLCLPIVYSYCFQAVLDNQVDYFLGFHLNQIALYSLMRPLDPNYAKQMWVFQSCLFFRDGKAIDGIGDCSTDRWHQWVLANAEQFRNQYQNGLIPFTKSGANLTNLPVWGQSIADFSVCDEYIKSVWGYSSNTLRSLIDDMEYKALTVYMMYASLTNP